MDVDKRAPVSDMTDVAASKNTVMSASDKACQSQRSSDVSPTFYSLDARCQVAVHEEPDAQHLFKLLERGRRKESDRKLSPSFRFSLMGERDPKAHARRLKEHIHECFDFDFVDPPPKVIKVRSLQFEIDGQI